MKNPPERKFPADAGTYASWMIDPDANFRQNRSYVEGIAQTIVEEPSWKRGDGWSMLEEIMVVLSETLKEST